MLHLFNFINFPYVWNVKEITILSHQDLILLENDVMLGRFAK